MWGAKRVLGVPLNRETIRSLTKAASDIAQNNWAPKHLLAERLRLCHACPYGGTRCDMCGCFVKTKAALLSSECPIGTWPSSESGVDGGEEHTADEKTDE